MEFYIDQNQKIHPWWINKEGRKMKIPEMETQHLYNSAKRILDRRWRTEYFFFINEELIKREDFRIQEYISDYEGTIWDSGASISMVDVWRMESESLIIEQELFLFPDHGDALE